MSIQNTQPMLPTPSSLPLGALEQAVKCPILQDRMSDPVTTVPAGQTYERAFIEEWLGHKGTDPITRESVREVVPNYLAKGIIDLLAQQEVGWRDGSEGVLTDQKSELKLAIKVLSELVSEQSGRIENQAKEIDQLKDQMALDCQAYQEQGLKLASREAEIKELREQLLRGAPDRKKRKGAIAVATSSVAAQLQAAVPALAFGKAQWEKYFGDVGEVPPLPENIGQILLSECPFNPAKTVGETHLLTLIPREIRPKGSEGFLPFTLHLLGDLIQKPAADGHKTKYRYIDGRMKNEATAAEESQWVLLSRDVLEGSRGKSREKQMELCSQKAGYQAPTLLEAATSILMHFVVFGERVFSDDPWTYACCQEQVDVWKTVVGGFSAAGLDVGRDWDCGNVGAAPLRKL